MRSVGEYRISETVWDKGLLSEISAFLKMYNLICQFLHGWIDTIYCKTLLVHLGWPTIACTITKQRELCLIIVINCIKYCKTDIDFQPKHTSVWWHWVRYLTSGHSRGNGTVCTALEVTLDEGKSTKWLISRSTPNLESHNWHSAKPCLLLTSCTLATCHLSF